MTQVHKQPEFPEFGEKPDEVMTVFMDLSPGTIYRVWEGTTGRFLSFTSKLVKIESELIQESDQGMIAPFLFLRFENGVSVKSRHGYGLCFYKTEGQP